MVSIMSLWLPIMIAAILVFLASSVIHMMLSYHRSDVRGLDDEDGLMDALRGFNLAPGDYFFPHAKSSKEMASPEFQAKSEKGPVGTMTIYPPGGWGMGKSLGLWFLYCVLVGVVAAYVTGRTLPAGAEYMQVMQISSTVAFCCYGMSLPQASIWWKRNWAATLKSMFDAVIYGLLTGGAFGWLWP